MARDPTGECFKALTTTKYIAIAKPKSAVPGDIRPIGITLALRRIFGKYVMIESGKLIGEEKSTPNLRWAFHPARGCPDGCERRYRHIERVQYARAAALFRSSLQFPERLRERKRLAAVRHLLVVRARTLPARAARSFFLHGGWRTEESFVFIHDTRTTGTKIRNEFRSPGEA